jgi:hypothetical protein
MVDLTRYLSFKSSPLFGGKKRGILHWLSVVAVLSLISMLCGFLLGSVIS